MSNKTNGHSQFDRAFQMMSPEKQRELLEILDKARKAPYAHLLEQLIPDGVKMIKLLDKPKKDEV